ncbi:MAG TPA: hypothetical protein VFZ53_32495, partial [Polyangiaceae bacterium]
MKSFARIIRTPVVAAAWVLGSVGAIAACGSADSGTDDGGDASSGSSGTATGGTSGAAGAGISGSPATGGAAPTGGTAGSGTGGAVPTGGTAGGGAASTGGAGGNVSGAGGALAGSGGTIAGAGGALGGSGGTVAGSGGAGGTIGGVGGAAGKSGMAGAAGKAGGGPLPAFPGADGAAGLVSGGRGGDVCHVTVRDLNFGDTRAGTLGACLQGLTGPRTVVFDISGVFALDRSATAGYTADGNGWDTASRLNIPANVTLAGQTAPGPVIITGGSLRPGATNIIIRNITVAPGYGRRNFHEASMTPASGDFPDSYVFDAFDISGQNVMIDHVTTVYATDETISCNEEANNLTIQYSNISQGQNYPQADAESSGVSYTGHALGSLLQAGSNAKISVLFNLYAHQKGRLPRIGTEADALTTAGVGAYNDFRNNVFYNWLGTAGTGASGQVHQTNFISNFYLAGPGGDNPSGGSSTAVTNASGGTSIFNGSDSSLSKVHHSGNMKDTNKDGDASDGAALANSDFGSSAFQGSAYTQTPYRGVTATAAAAYTYVLNHVGARWWQRGPVDTRLVAETRAGSGKIVAWADDPFNSSTSEGTEWRALYATASTSRPAGFDSDNDGMPNTWEMTYGTNPSTADNNGDLDADGYTNLEEYLNEIAAWPAVAALQFTGRQNSRYAQIQNWMVGPSKNHTGIRTSAHWQPSRYDTAQITAGTAIVDAPGQHAGTLEVGTSGALEVTGGWLEAERAVTVGGRLSLRAGALFTRELAKAPRGGIFEFAGGSLSADLVRFDLVNYGGVLAPGRNHVGETNVAGDVRLRGGAYVVNVTRGGSDIVRASGKATLGGTLRIDTNDGYAPRGGESWTILVAEGGVTGRFESVPEGYVVSIAGGRVLVTYGEALD